MDVTRKLTDAEWLHQPALRRIFALLDAHGEEARVVGGAVRNALMGLPPGDLDLATTATPDEVMRRARDAGIKCVPTGFDHGTVTLVVDGHPFEITTLREDVETFGRKARVRFGRSWEHDAQRRDFTVNALSVSSDDSVHDYTGGLADIAARRVRFIGDAGRRIAEDYLRILRFFRFHAAYGHGDPDEDGLRACIRGRDGLAQLSAERIRAEMLKLLLAPGALAATQSMADTGLLLRLFGGVSYQPAFAGMIAAEATLGLGPDPVRRLAALAVVVREDAERLAIRLRLSNAEARRLDSMAHRWRRFVDLVAQGNDDAPFKARLYRLGTARFQDRVMMGFAQSGADEHAARWRDLYRLAETWPVPACPYRAADFIPRGFSPGPALGDVLALAEEYWIAAGFPQDAASVNALADRAAETFRHDHAL